MTGEDLQRNGVLQICRRGVGVVFGGGGAALDFAGGKRVAVQVEPGGNV